MRYSFVAIVSALVALCSWSPMSSADLLDWIFADSFETGDPSTWSTAVGPIQVLPEAASEGAFGLRVPMISGEPGWVQDENLENETVIRTDFDLNVDGLVMTDGDAFDVYIGWVFEDSAAAFALTVEREFGIMSLRLTAYDNASNPITSAPVILPTTGWHRIAIEFGAATGPGNTGELRLFVNGRLEAEITDFDNDGINVKAARLGAARGVDQGTSGYVDIDAYTSVRLFNPWPCVRYSGANPANGAPVCLDGEGRNTAIATGGCGDGVAAWEGLEDLTMIHYPRSRLGGIYGKKVTGAAGRQTDDRFTIVEDERAATPDIAMDDACNSVVTWKTDLETQAIFAAVFDIDGQPVAGPVAVAGGADLEELPAVGVADSGDFFIAWRRETLRAQTIWGRHFMADTTPTQAEFQLDQGSGAVSEPAVSTNPDGASVVVWATNGAIVALLIDNNGQPLGHVPVTSGPGDDEPAVAATDDGGFVAVWIRQEGDRQVFMRRFDPSGAPISGETRVDTLNPADCSAPGVEVEPGDGATVVWASLFDGQHTIRGRRFAADGNPDGSEFVIEGAGPVWLPARPDVAVADRLLFSFVEETNPFGYARGSLVGAFTVPDLFFDGFESGTTDAWSLTGP